MKHDVPFNGTTPNSDAERVSTTDVPNADPDERVTGKLAKYLDLLDKEMAERWTDTSAA